MSARGAGPGPGAQFTLFGLVALGLGIAAFAIAAGDEFRTRADAIVMAALAVLIGRQASKREDNFTARGLGFAGMAIGILFFAIYAYARATGWG